MFTESLHGAWFRVMFSTRILWLIAAVADCRSLSRTGLIGNVRSPRHLFASASVLVYDALPPRFGLERMKAPLGDLNILYVSALPSPVDIALAVGA